MQPSVFLGLAELAPELEIRFGEPMKNHTSFRVGGPAAALLLPKSVSELRAAASFLRREGIKHYVMGNGTNLLFPDEGYDGAVVKTSGVSAAAREGETSLCAECGASMASVAVFARKLSLSGLEFAHGIPGSVGGGVFMNAGAYGGEMAEVVSSVAWLDKDGRERESAGAQLGFAYRRSNFTEADIILSARFKLTPGDGEAIAARMAELSEKRRASQPLDKPSAGSAFKRPKTGYAAALIDEAGLKGLSVGGAQVSEKHAGFIINAGGATAEDIIRLMDAVREAVFKASGVELEPEIRVVR
jgi:UDP-N-acetylmuramate dehydrogenase